MQPGIRQSKFAGFASQNLLALIANASSRGWLRENHRERTSKRPPARAPRPTPTPTTQTTLHTPPAAEYDMLCEQIFNTNDVENYFAALVSHVGYKPAPHTIEKLAQRVDYIHQTEGEVGRGRTRRGRKYYSPSDVTLARSGARTVRWNDGDALKDGSTWCALVRAPNAGAHAHT